jgi:hypothetical protein
MSLRRRAFKWTGIILGCLILVFVLIPFVLNQYHSHEMKGVRLAVLDIQGAIFSGVNVFNLSSKVNALGTAILAAKQGIGANDAELGFYALAMSEYSKSVNAWGDQAEVRKHWSDADSAIERAKQYSAWYPRHLFALKDKVVWRTLMVGDVLNVAGIE